MTTSTNPFLVSVTYTVSTHRRRIQSVTFWEICTLLNKAVAFVQKRGPRWTTFTENRRSGDPTCRVAQGGGLSCSSTPHLPLVRNRWRACFYRLIFSLLKLFAHCPKTRHFYAVLHCVQGRKLTLKKRKSKHTDLM